MAITLIDKIFKKYKKTINMSFSELKQWGSTDLSKKSGLSRVPFRMNLELLKTPKNRWGAKQIKWAIRIIKFVNSTKKKKKGTVISRGLSKRDIVLKNWGFNIKK